MATQAQVVEATKKHLVPNYARIPVAMVRGRGARIWDADGKEYVDFFAGFGAGGVAGHCHPAVSAAIKAQADTLLCAGNIYTNEPQARLAEAITKHAFGGKVFFCHSGAEANEAALKVVRLAARKADGARAPRRYKIISFHNCFHGRTMGALSLTPRKFHKGFEPMLPGNVMLDLNDLDAVRDAIDDRTAGIFVEPIQGEGGINLPTREFLTGLRELCDKHNLLLVCDEVWTSPARTGKWFGYQLHGVEPDVMTLGKALGGGVPVAACVVGPKREDLLQPGTHGCTLGGNPLCAAAGAAVMKLIEDERLVERAEREGGRIMQAIRDAKLPVVKEVRGAGMMIGIEITKPGKEFFTKCLERGLLINCTRETVLRLAPPLVATDQDLRQGLDILLQVLRG